MPVRKTPKAKKAVKKAIKTPKARATVNKERSVVKSKELGIATVRKAKKAKSETEPKPYQRKGEILKSPDINRLRRVLLPEEKVPRQRRRRNIPFQHYSNINAPSRRQVRYDVPYLRPRPVKSRREHYKKPLYHKAPRRAVDYNQFARNPLQEEYATAPIYQGEPVAYMEQYSEPESESEQEQYQQPISQEEQSSVPFDEQLRILERTPIKDIKSRIRSRGLGPAFKGYQKELDREKLIKKLKRKPFDMAQLFD